MIKKIYSIVCNMLFFWVRSICFTTWLVLLGLCIYFLVEWMGRIWSMYVNFMKFDVVIVVNVNVNNQ
jgi:hypothetical protein